MHEVDAEAPATLRAAVDALGLDLWLQVDGGVTEDTIAIAAEAGADTFVAGSSVFNSARRVRCRSICFCAPLPHTAHSRAAMV
jgi:pentose-5-phosphate-3-epimerase